MYNGMNIRMPESCVDENKCGTITPLWLNGSHPQIEDGIVTRLVCGRSGSDCCYYRSTPIRVKACPGNYYVYEFVRPTLFCSAHCADVSTIMSISTTTMATISTKLNTTTVPFNDPCNSYTALDQPWRATNVTGLNICDRDFNWNGWYRLLYNGMSIRMPESCVNMYTCGSDIPLGLSGPHPQIGDGIVTRGVCINSLWTCWYYYHYPYYYNDYRDCFMSIRVRACPGSYYVYEFVRPNFCNAAYCADVNTITPTIAPTVITSTAVSADNITFDPCNTSSVLDNYWRSVYNNYRGQDDTLVEWSGWYRLYLQGQSAQIPEFDWCWSLGACGGYTPLFLGGSHPLPRDGIITQKVYGTYGSVTQSRKCNFYKSNPIQVKACPGNYYVYRLVKPAVSVPMPTYCAVTYNTPSYDPCNNYTPLDQPWRATNSNGLNICDRDFNWNGWYRLLYYGMSVRMPESCVDMSSCGTYTTLWLNGSHPQKEDGIVTRGVCGRSGSDCCSYRFIPVRVKACPGNYYVYEFVRPNFCTAAYCADVSSITPTTAPNTATSDSGLSTITGIPNNPTFEPCNVYRGLNNDWRSYYYVSYLGQDDTLVEWSGWYRLYLQGKSAQIPESDWCWSNMACGGYTPLFLGGTHPRPQDGIVTRDVYGTYGSVTESRKCYYYRSNPIQVKACPGNYYVYRLVKPAVSVPMPTYCAAAFDTPPYDPCNNYTPLDQPWRATNATGLDICDSNFNWNGWYRLLYNGMSVRMPESCVDVSRCGTYYTLWLSGSHPQIEDGIVPRGVCGRSGSDCCYYRFIPIRVKACPGNYYVYEFVGPTICSAAYCADVNAITPPTAPTTPTGPSIITAGSPNNMTFDPCSASTILDNSWRKTDGLYYSGFCGFDDTLIEWSGWYRLYLQGKSAQIPESGWCASYMTCGGYTPLLLGGSHPQLQDGIVTREIYGSYGYVINSSQCNSYRSNSIQVKACPGNYYVYRLVKPAVSIPMPTYCAVALDSPSYDPCNIYTVLDQPWRATNAPGGSNCDSFNGNVWYRLLYYGMNIRMPESCVNRARCGTDVTLWLNGSHPQIEDGIVTRGVCGGSGSDCCYYRSIPIRVKACPGNYYVYELIRPTLFCNALQAAYCADVNTITSIVTPTTTTIGTEFTSTPNVSTIMPVYTTTPAINMELTTGPSITTVIPAAETTDVSTIMPVSTTSPTISTELTTTPDISTTPVLTTTVSSSTQLTTTPMAAPAETTDVSTTPVPTTTASSSSQLTTTPNVSTTSLSTTTVAITPELTTTAGTSTGSTSAETTDVITMPASTTIVTTSTKLTTTPYMDTTPISTSTISTILTTTPGASTAATPAETTGASTAATPAETTEVTMTSVSTTPTIGTKLNAVAIQTITMSPQCQIVKKVLQEQVLNIEVMNADQPVSTGNTVLNKTEILVSTLVNPTETIQMVDISLNDLEIRVFAVGPRAFLKENPMLSINNTQMDIDLIGISQNNNGSAAVAFMSYTNMMDMLSPKLFNPTKNTENIMMSTVVSATLPKTTNTQLPTPVNFTIKHIKDLPPNSTLFCVYWNHSEWIVDGCYLLQTNISHSVCSCFHLSTFALIMQVNPPTEEDSDPVMDPFNTVAVAVGLLFLCLTLLTFAFCRRNPRVTNIALTNLCISLLLAHLLFLLTQTFLQYIQPQQLLCEVLAGVLHFLFLSAFVWMFIQAVLLFISVKNLKKIRSKQKEVLSWKYLLVIGYSIPLMIVGVSVGLFSNGYGSKQCWLKADGGFLWSFLGPVCFILAANMIVFINIVVIIFFTLKRKKHEALKIKRAKNDEQRIKSVILKTLIQFYIVGCSWILGFFTDYNEVLEVVFLFFSSQQGTFIFLIHCALNQEVRQLYMKWWRDFSAACRPHIKKTWKLTRMVNLPVCTGITLNGLPMAVIFSRPTAATLCSPVNLHSHHAA
ncbi:hypothetical protein MHYP_G00101540 [Metynnis hypsauchen]